MPIKAQHYELVVTNNSTINLHLKVPPMTMLITYPCTLHISPHCNPTHQPKRQILTMTFLSLNGKPSFMFISPSTSYSSLKLMAAPTPYMPQKCYWFIKTMSHLKLWSKFYLPHEGFTKTRISLAFNLATNIPLATHYNTSNLMTQLTSTHYVCCVVRWHIRWYVHALLIVILVKLVVSLHVNHKTTYNELLQSPTWAFSNCPHICDPIYCPVHSQNQLVLGNLTCYLQIHGLSKWHPSKCHGVSYHCLDFYHAWAFHNGN